MSSDQAGSSKTLDDPSTKNENDGTDPPMEKMREELIREFTNYASEAVETALTARQQAAIDPQGTVAEQNTVSISCPSSQAKPRGELFTCIIVCVCEAGWFFGDILCWDYVLCHLCWNTYCIMCMALLTPLSWLKRVSQDRTTHRCMHSPCLTRMHT